MDRGLFNPFREQPPINPGFAHPGGPVPTRQFFQHGAQLGGRPFLPHGGPSRAQHFGHPPRGFGPRGTAAPGYMPQRYPAVRSASSGQFRGHRPPGNNRYNGMRGGNGRGRGGSHGNRFGGSPYGPGLFGSSRSAGAPGASLPMFYCEPCEKEFRNENSYTEHVEKHVKCPKCEFVGVFDTIEEHFEMVHLSMLLSKSKVPETAEDLKRWRAERARNYPRAKKPKNAGASPTSLCSLVPRSAVKGDRRNTDVADLSDGEIQDDEPAQNRAVTPCVSGLASVFANYGSDSDSEPDKIPSELCTPLLSVKTEKGAGLNLKSDAVPAAPSISGESQAAPSGSSVPDAVFHSDAVPFVEESTQIRPKVTAPPLRRKPFHPPAFPARKPRTLYEKLLAKDIEYENDQLLQCAAYICQNSFFQTAPKKRKEP